MQIEDVTDIETLPQNEALPVIISTASSLSSSGIARISSISRSSKSHAAGKPNKKLPQFARFSFLPSPSTLNRFMTNFYSFDKVVRSLRLRSDTKPAVKPRSSFLNNLLVQTLVKYEKNVIFPHRLNAANRNQTSTAFPVMQLFAAPHQKPKYPYYDENNNRIDVITAVDLVRRETSGNQLIYEDMTDEQNHVMATKAQCQIIPAFNRREFILRVLDLNFFLVL